MFSSPQPPSCGVVVFVPAWEDDKYVEWSRASKYLRLEVRLRRKEHDYRDGMQHSAARTVWSANVDSLVFFMFNETGWDQALKKFGAMPSPSDPAMLDPASARDAEMRFRASFEAAAKAGEDEDLRELCFKLLPSGVIVR